MRLAEIAENYEIDPLKFTQYALNPDSPYGRHKAFVFERSLGINLTNYNLLIEQIQRQIASQEFVFQKQDKFGKRYFSDMLIEGPQGKHAMVRTGWFIKTDSNLAQLATIYVKKR